MKVFVLGFFLLITVYLSGNEYIYDYANNNNLQTGYYDVLNEVHIQYEILEYILPLDEEVISAELIQPKYKTSIKSLDIFTGDFTITDGNQNYQIIEPSPLFPKDETILYTTYFKKGIQILTLKIPHQRYRYKFKEFDILQSAKIIITTKHSESTSKSQFLTNLSDFSTITNDKVIDTQVRNSYYSHYSSRQSSNRNALGLNPTEMLIISPSNLVNIWNIYADYKNALGINSQVVNIDDILANYSGRDNAEKLRNCLIELYTEWASNETPMTYVLLGGDHNLIPSRALRVSASYNGSWHTNTIYSDLYYAGLDGDWDNDQDNLFGEGDANEDSQATGSNGEEADLYAEVYVGRIPVETTAELENWINKQEDYETAQVSENFYEKALLLGQYLGSSIYAAPAMNEIANYLSDYSIQTLYQQDGTYSEAALTSAINSGISQIHHLAHGSNSEVFSISESDIINNLINQDYPLIYTQGCHTANLTLNDAIGEDFIIQQRGAFAYIGNTSYGFYSTFENQGPSQLFHRKFVNAFTEEGINEIGKVHLEGKEDLIGITSQTGTRRYVYFDNILFADPSTSIIKEFTSVSVEQLSDSSIELSFPSTMGSEVLSTSNYLVYQRDDEAEIYPVTSIDQLGNTYYLNFSTNLPAGIPLRIEIDNIPNLLNPTKKLVKPLYTIKESSIISPTTWTADESPIYVYKHQIINSILTIEAGTEIRVNSGKSFYTYWGGEIRVEGDSLNYVNFTSYSNDPQADDKWVDLTFMMDPSPNSYFNYTMIKNSQSGIWLDSLSTISLNHVRFHDNEDYGIYSKHSVINADYLEFTAIANPETSAFRIIGGQLDINHLTSSENAGWELEVSDSAVLSISNSIIWGQNNLASDFITINYSILQSQEAGSDNLTSDPLFTSSSDLRLQSTSPAINSGDVNILDPDNTITDRGYWYFYHPNTFQAEIVANSSPQRIKFTNLSLGNYDSLEWDFDNDGLWDSSQVSPQHLYLSEDTFSVKLRLTKSSFTQDILITNLVQQSLVPLEINFPLTIDIANEHINLNWSPLANADLYQVTSASDLNSDFESLSIQEDTSYTEELQSETREFYQIIPLEQIINIGD